MLGRESWALEEDGEGNGADWGVGGVGREGMSVCFLFCVLALIIIMYIYHAFINALCAHMIHINLNRICCTHVERNPTKTIYIKYYTENKNKQKYTRLGTDISWDKNTVRRGRFSVRL